MRIGLIVGGGLLIGAFVAMLFLTVTQDPWVGVEYGRDQGRIMYHCQSKYSEKTPSISVVEGGGESVSDRCRDAAR